MQILADGYVNINVVVLLKFDIVTHLILNTLIIFPENLY